MALICIQECSKQTDIFHTKVSFNHGPAYEVTIRDPFSKGEEERLEWYFEEHLKFPFTDQVKAQAAATSITAYGEKLFEQVFAADPNILAAYKTTTKSGMWTVQIEILGEPPFHALHWEALKDPELPHPLALQATIVRRNAVPQGAPTTVRSSPRINLLVITARPRGRRDMGYRTISGPLVETLRQADVPVQIDILRPGTYKALENHLREITDRRGVGYYHVIHFDTHGSLLTYEEFRIMNRSKRTQRSGRRDIRPYEGLRAFLALEGEQDGAADLVEAEELASVLMQHQIPIAILNACQSGKQVGDRETSLGSHLMQAGVQMVVAMGYTVTVSAAELLMRAQYQHLFAKEGLAIAMRHGRTALYNHKTRRAYFDQRIELEDWMLPVVYQNQEHILQVRAFTPEESAAFDRRAATNYDSPQPRYGFVGRDLDILQIEKRLLTKRNIVLVRGMGGAGKTTLLRHLGAWWKTTGFVDKDFYFGYDEMAWTRQQIFVTIARQLLSETEYVRDFQPLSLELQQALLVKLLRAQNHLLILDNLESITGSPLAIQHILPLEEQRALQNLLRDLVGGRTLVLLGSRSGEHWLARSTFEDNVYELQGLDPEAASTLADRILERHNATHYRGEDSFRKLLKLLDGFPMALEVVLANLAHQTPVEVLTALQGGDVKLDAGDSHDKTASILHCIDYSHSNLSPDAQRLLLCLAPFTSVINLPSFDKYTALLRQQPALSLLPFDRWQEFFQEAANWGLLIPDPPDDPLILRLQPILSYFLRSRLNVPEQAEVRKSIETAFRLLYDEVSPMLLSLIASEDPRERQAGQVVVHLDFENLATALNLALDEQVSVVYPYFALSGYLKAIQDTHRGLKLGQDVLRRLEAYPADKLRNELGEEFVRIIGDVATRQFDLKQYAAAKESYHRILELVNQLENIDEKEYAELISRAFDRLGIVAQEQQRWKEAEIYYQQALDVRARFNNDGGQALTYHYLGTLALKQHDVVKAEQYYQQALDILVEHKDRQVQADTYHQLGMVAEEQRQWLKAEQHYKQALQIFVEYHDRYAQADACYQLGRVAEEQQKWVQAQKYYQQALQIFIEYNDRQAQADTYRQLAYVAQEQQQWQQAEQYYQQALQVYLEYGNRYAQAGTYHNLGLVAQEQRQWQQAEQYYQQALQIKFESNDRFAQASTYGQLGTLADERRNWSQAEQYYQQALQIYTEYNNPYKQAGMHYNLAVIAQKQRKESLAGKHYLKALEIFVEYRDDNRSGSALHNLAYLWQASGDASLPAAIASNLGVTTEEIEKRLNKELENEPDTDNVI